MDAKTYYTCDELYRVASVAATPNKGSALSASYTYESYGRVSKETYEDGDFVTYLYDNDGSLGSVTDSSSGITTSYFYDLAGRLVDTRRTGENGEHSVLYSYNSKNPLVRHKETFDNTTRTVYYGYDEHDRLEYVQEGTTKDTYAYDGFGRLSTSTLTHDNTEVMKETYGYRGTSTTTTGQVSSLSITTPGSYGASYSYAYDINGNIKTVTGNDGTTTYVYDSANQLIREDNQAAGKTWVYTHDNGGNMYRCVITDANGNTVTSNAGEISVITETWQYTYDADGLRTKATNGYETYEYTYDGGKLTSMVVNEEDVFYFFYDGNGKPMLFMYNGIKYFYATNLQGDVTAIVSVGGNEKVEYTYDAWGNILSITGTHAATLGELNPLRYRGYVYDQPSQLYYLQSRYYSPQPRPLP